MAFWIMKNMRRILWTHSSTGGVSNTAVGASSFDKCCPVTVTRKACKDRIKHSHCRHKYFEAPWCFQSRSMPETNAAASSDTLVPNLPNQMVSYRSMRSWRRRMTSEVMRLYGLRPLNVPKYNMLCSRITFSRFQARFFRNNYHYIIITL